MQALVNAAAANGVNYGTYASGEQSAKPHCALHHFCSVTICLQNTCGAPSWVDAL
jgi:hypothetical protein